MPIQKRSRRSEPFAAELDRARVAAVDVFVVRMHGRDWRVLALERAPGVRCTGAWETVHGRIERGEAPHEAAIREVREETGLAVDRLYNVTTHAFYLHAPRMVMIAPVFVAFVRGNPAVRLSDEHSRAVWLTRGAAKRKLAWPSEREHLDRAWAMLAPGHAGALDDVLLVSGPNRGAGRGRRGRSA